MVTSQEDKDLSCEESDRFKLLSEYLDFLGNHRGLKKKTISVRGHDVTAFLKSLRLQNDREDIRRISVSQVYDYVIKTVKPMKRPTRKRFVSSIRSFLKFAHLKGYIRRDLTEAVPAVETPKLGSIPRGISWESVEKLLAVAGTNLRISYRKKVLCNITATGNLWSTDRSGSKTPFAGHKLARGLNPFSTSQIWEPSMLPSVSQMLQMHCLPI